MKPQEPLSTVKTGTQYIRMTYIANYLEWMSKRILEDQSTFVGRPEKNDIGVMVASFRTQRPLVKGRAQENSRVGLSADQRKELLTLVQVGNDRNPFTNENLQIRNQLIVYLLYYLGIRRGEMLKIKIGDINFKTNNLLIARRPDDPDEERLYPPDTKTNDRILPVKDTLMQIIKSYIFDIRLSIPGAKKHPYLLVTHKLGPYCGKPLTLMSVNKILVVLRQQSDLLPDNLSPHVLRHTTNDRFSENADEEGISPADEEKSRSYLFGWQEGSGTASTYTKRHDRKKGRECALKLQELLEQGELKNE